jgi:hypothetical protein
LRWLRSPALHFVLIGGVLFAGAQWLAPRGATRAPAAVAGAPPSAPLPAPKVERLAIVFTVDRVAQLAHDFENQYGRTPTRAELAGFVNEAADNELLEREARRLDLGAGDPSVRLRLLQKMRVVGFDPTKDEDAHYREALRLGLDDDVMIRRLLREKLRLALSRDPTDAVVTDADLREYVERHRERYERPGAVTFAHVFFSTRDDAKRARTEAESALRELHTRNMTPPASDDLSDAFPLGLAFTARPEDALTAQFGEKFALRVLAAPPGKWIGPIASMYGLHLVRVQERLPAELPTIEILRARAARELLQERAGARLAVAMQRLRAEYDIRIDLPRDSAATADNTTLTGTR